MKHEFEEYLELDSSAPSGLRWTKRNGRIKPGDTAGTMHKNKRYYVIQYFGTKYNCEDVVAALKNGELSEEDY